MFEAAELGRKVSKKEFEAIAPTLRIELLEAQRRLREADFPVLVYFAGVDGAGKGGTINELQSWLDPRHLVTQAYGAPSDEERERPEYWRYWRDLPPRGKIGFFLSAWYSRAVLDRVNREINRARFDERIDQICAFEQALADDGALILKFWMHLGQKAQRKRFEALEKDPLQRWRVTKTDWSHFRLYDRFIATAERALMRTSTGDAPWAIVEGADPRYRFLTVATMLRDAITKHLEAADLRRKVRAAAADEKKPSPIGEASASAELASASLVESTAVPAQPSILDALDMTQKLPKKVYERELDKRRGQLNKLYRKAKQQGISTILVFEGWDAGGKGGAIRRLVSALDARDYQVIPIAAPTDEERAHHYLWRFWRHIARAGRVTIFDRSWYGRVLVERVEGFASEKEWRRSYAEMNRFEEELTEHGIVLVKYWLHITKEEQLARFEARQQTPFKRWKITDEDWRNRERWDDYEAAVNDMVERTSTRIAPWTLVEANDKRSARVKVIKTLCDRYKAVL